MKFGIYLLLAKLAVLALALADDVDQRIKDGGDTGGGDFSFTAKIVSKGKQVCSGILVESEWVATLSICVNEKKLSKYKVYFSSTKSKGKKPDVKRTIKRMKIADQKNSDIVLLQLNKKVKQDKDKVQAYDRFSSKEIDEKMKSCKAVGFSENGKKLNEVAINIKATSKCSGSTSEKRLCFDTKEGSVCKVDNGSPILCKYNSKWYLMGTSLVTQGCKSTGIKGLRLSFFSSAITDIVNGDGKKTDCGPVPDVAKGNYELVEGLTTVGSTYKVTCFYGYKTKKKVLKCQASGKWQTTQCKEEDDFDIYRIPQDFNPLLYNVELRPDIYVDEADFRNTGSVRILLHCLKSTNIITLNINGLSIDGNIYVKPENEAENLYRKYEIDETRQILYILTNRQVEAGQNYILKINEFSGSLESTAAGLYYGFYMQGNDKVYYVTSQLEPVEGRKIFPCFDEPAMKSQFDITLLRKRNMTSISNMPLSKSTDRGDGWIADKFDRTPIMSTYILAFVVCDFDHLEQTTTNGIEFRTWSRPEVVNQTSYSLDIGGRMMTFFEDSFTIPYPLPKEDMVAVNNFAAGAMENWGLIIYREKYMLYEPGKSTNLEKQYVAIIVAHELAHMWFGNLVSPAWWSDIWLNEGFATYFEYVGVDFVHPDWKMLEQFIKDTQQYVLWYDSTKSTTHPVHIPVSKPDDLIDIFDTISYSKGACVVRMLKFLVGDATFNSGIIKYLKQLKYNVASSDDLWAALRNQSIEDNNNITDIKGIMDTWILQKNYPVVNVKFSTTGQITLKQRRYLTYRNATDPGTYTSPYGYKWNIPFAYATSIDKQFNVTNDDITIMDKDVDKVTIIDSNIPEPTGNNWILGNPMQYGFYRVNYDDRNWNALAEQLNSNHHVIPTISRAQLIDDAWSLYDSGDLGLLPALRLTEYLNNEKKWLPWATVGKHIKKIGPKIESYPIFAQYKKFMQNKTKDLSEKLTLNGDGLTHLNSYLQEVIRDDVRACDYGTPGCVDDAKQLFSQWMENENKTIDNDIKTIVYCTSIAEGGTEYWDFVVDQLEALEGGYQVERSYLIYALSCTKNTSNIQQLIQMAADPEGFLVDYLSLVLDYVSRNPAGRPLAWNYVTTNWDYLLNERTRGLQYGIGDSLYTIMLRLTTEEELNELETFAEEIKEDVDNDYFLAIVIDEGMRATQEKLDWLNINLPVIQQWLVDQGY